MGIAAGWLCPACRTRGAGCIEEGEILRCTAKQNGTPRGYEHVRETLGGENLYRRLPELQKPKPPGLRVIPMATVTLRAVRWLWPGRVPLGKLTAFVGDPKIGKSVLTLDLAARVSMGAGWPDLPHDPRPEPGRVLILSAEDDVDDTVAPRLAAAGANLALVDVIAGVAARQGAADLCFCIDRDLPHLERHLAATPGVKLLIVDPVSAFMGRVDSHVNAEVRGALAPLAALAARHGLAVVTVTHMTKAGGSKALYRAMGSLAFTATARAVWTVSLDPADKSRRLLLNAGCNLARDLGGLAYTLRESIGNRDVPVVAWEAGPVNMSADEALEAEARPEAEKTALQEAEDWLRDELRGGPVDSEYIDGKARAEGVAIPTLKRARARLGVKAVQVRDGKRIVGWKLSLPGAVPAQEDQGAHTQQHDHLDTLGLVDTLASEPENQEAQGDQGDQGDHVCMKDL